jgi:predicted DNA-binding antitoxin AbrB/MazE fold protein
MTQVIEAIFSQGVLKPLDPLELFEDQRVRVTVEPVMSLAAHDREAAIKRWKEGIASMNFRLTGPLPSRDELHDRV